MWIGLLVLYYTEWVVCRALFNRNANRHRQAHRHMVSIHVIIALISCHFRILISLRNSVAERFKQKTILTSNMIEAAKICETFDRSMNFCCSHGICQTVAILLTPWLVLVCIYCIDDPNQMCFQYTTFYKPTLFLPLRLFFNQKCMQIIY